MSELKEEKFFEQWYDKNEKRFHHGQFSEKQIAYSSFVNGFNYNRKIILELEQQNKEILEALIKATKYMQIQRPFMNYSDDVELYENNIKIIESVTGKDIEEIIT